MATQNPKKPSTRKEVELTGDFETDIDIIGDAYKPDDIDTDTWRGLYRAISGLESGGNPNVGEAKFGRIPKGKRATGIMQVLPSTGVGLGFTEDEIRNDPAMNFAAGVKYLSQNWSRLGKNKAIRNFDHRLAGTIASYHAGIGAVEADLANGFDGVPDIDDGGMNTRDYTGNILDRLKSFTPQSGSAAQSGAPVLGAEGAVIDSEDGVTLREMTAQEAADLEAGERQKVGAAVMVDEAGNELSPLEKRTQPSAETQGYLEALRQRTTTSRRFDANEMQTKPRSVFIEDASGARRPASGFEEDIIKKDKRIREQLGLITPASHPHKAAESKVTFPYKPGEPINSDVLSDAIVTALTGDSQLGAKFREAVGENPGEFDDEITNEWLQRQIEAGNLRYIPDPRNPQAGGYLEGNIPIQNFIRRRVQALAEGGVEGVRAETQAMRKEIAETERLVAEEEYGKAIFDWQAAEQEAIKRGDAEGRREAAANWMRLQAELDSKYPDTNLGEMYKGFKTGLSRGMYNILRTGANVGNLAEPLLDNSPEAKAERAAREQRVRRLEMELERQTPDARNFMGQLAEAATSEIVYSPVYILGGATLGPGGNILTAAVRSANKPVDEALQDIAAAMFEVVGGTVLKGALTAGKGLSVRKELLAEMSFGGITEAGGEALIDVAKGKVPDWQNALKSLIIGAGMEAGAGVRGAIKGGERAEGEGEVSFDVAEARQFPTEVRSPIFMTEGEDGNPKFGAIIRQGENVGFVEIPARHPIIIKHSKQVEDGAASFVGVKAEDFDTAVTEWQATGAKIKLPRLTGEGLRQYLSENERMKGLRDESAEQKPAEATPTLTPTPTPGTEEETEAEQDEDIQDVEQVEEAAAITARAKKMTAEERVADALARFDANPPVIRRRSSDEEDVFAGEEAGVDTDTLPADPAARARVLEARRRFDEQPPVIKRGDAEPEQRPDTAPRATRKADKDADARIADALRRFDAEPPSIVRRDSEGEVIETIQPKPKAVTNEKQGQKQTAEKRTQTRVAAPKEGEKVAVKPAAVERDVVLKPASPAKTVSPTKSARASTATSTQAATQAATQVTTQVTIKPQASTGKKVKRAFKGEEYDLDEDLAAEFDAVEKDYRASLAAAGNDRSKKAKIGRAFGEERRAFIEEQRQRDAESRFQAAESEATAQQRKRESDLSQAERDTLESAYKKLGVRDDESIRNLLYQANRRYVKKIQGTEAQKIAAEADDRRNSLTDEEREALSKVIGANFTAPMKIPTIPGVTSDYTKAISGMTEEEFKRDVQLSANYRTLEDFFGAIRRGEVPPADLKEIGERLLEEDELTEEESAEKFSKEQKDIRQGTKKVRRGAVEITLPRGLASAWDAADAVYDSKRAGILSNSSLTAAQKDAKVRAIIDERKSARKRILNEFDALEKEQFKRGYEKSTGRPLQIIEDNGDTLVVRIAGSDANVRLKREQVETRGERAIRRKKEPKLPFGVRVRLMFNRFSNKSPRAVEKDGVIYMNDAMQNKLEDTLKVNEDDLTFFTFKKGSVEGYAATLEDAGFTQIAKWMREGSRSFVNVTADVNNITPGVASVHEQIHQVAEDFNLPESSMKWLDEQGNLEKVIEEALASGKEFVAEMNAFDLVQEVLAHGLTGDAEGLGIQPETLYNATLDVIQAYLRAFPNEDVNKIAEKALVNYTDIRNEAQRRIKVDEAQFQPKTSARPIQGVSQAAQTGQAEGSAEPVGEAAQTAPAASESKQQQAVEPEKAAEPTPAEAAVKATEAEKETVKPARVIRNTVRKMTDEEIKDKLESESVPVPERTTRRELEQAAIATVEQQVSEIVPVEAKEPAPITEAKESVAEEAKTKRAAPRRAKYADSALVAGWKAYRPGVDFETWAKEVDEATGDRMTNLLPDTWLQVRALNDWLNGSRALTAFLLSRLPGKSKAKDILPLIKTNDKGNSTATKAGVKQDEILWSGIEQLIEANPDADLNTVIRQLQENAPKLTIESLKSASEQLGATARKPSHSFTLSGKSKNQRHVLARWSNQPEGQGFKVEEHYGKDIDNVLFDVRMDDRETTQGENVLTFLEGQADRFQSTKSRAQKQGVEEAPAAPFKATWQQKLVEHVVNEAVIGGYAGVIMPRTAEQIAEIQKWQFVVEEDGKYFVYYGQFKGEEVTAVVNKYLKEFPKLFEKHLGVKPEVRAIDKGLGRTEEVTYFGLPAKKSDKEIVPSYQTFGYKRDVTRRNDNRAALEPDKQLEAVARQYSKVAEVQPYRVGEYHRYKQANITKLAEITAAAEHNPSDERVIASYNTMIDETLDQYLFLLSRGYKLEPWVKGGRPYSTVADMRQDVRDNKHLYFPLSGIVDASHPMAQASGFYAGDYQLTNGDVFRAVHDFYGHAVSGAQFGLRGEFNAADNHARLYSRAAIPAMLAETVFPTALAAETKSSNTRKAFLVTEDMVQEWLNAYEETPTQLLKTLTSDVTETAEEKAKRVYENALRKEEEDLTKNDVKATVERGRFALISGNIESAVSSEEGLKRTMSLATELRRMGYRTLDADGIYAPEGQPPTREPSLFVLLESEDDVANMLRLGKKYQQAQVLIGDNGEYRAPFTTNTPFGKVGFETTGEPFAVFGKDADKQIGKSKVKTTNGEIIFSTPNAFASTRAQGRAEKEAAASLEKAYNRSFRNAAKATSADLLDWLYARIGEGKREAMGVQKVGDFLTKATKKLYGEYPKDTLPKDEYDAVRARRAVKDAIATIKHFRKGKTDSQAGKSWYAESIDNAMLKTGEVFPEVTTVPQLQVLFKLVLSVASSGMKVQENYSAATQIWRRMIEEFQLGVAEDRNQDIFPVFQPDTPENRTKEGKLKRYGRFDPQLEKLNNLSRGLVPIESADAKKLIAEGKEKLLTRTQYFSKETGATQYYVKDAKLEQMLEEYGRIGGVLEYLLEPSDKPGHPYKAQEILGSKIGAFFLNLTGLGGLVTVDVWASRWFYRINGGLLNESAQFGVQDTPKNKRDGAIIRAVMQAAAKEWNATHEDKITPADVQAILWYAEKDIWSAAGAKDSGQIDFFDAAKRNIQEQWTNFDATRQSRERVISDWLAEAPQTGKTSQLGAVELSKENESFFIRQMALPARMGLAHTSRRQQLNNRMSNFDAHSWNYEAERVKGAPLEPHECAELSTLLNAGYRASTDTERNDAMFDLVKYLDTLAEQSLPEFILTCRRAGFLSGVRTVGRNVLGNFAYQVLNETSKGVSAPIDIIIAAVSKEDRVVQGISPRGILHGFRSLDEGWEAFKNTMKHGIAGASVENFNLGYDPRVRASVFTFGKSGAAFLNYTVGNIAKYIFRFQGATDQLFRTYAYNRALYELAALSQKNGGRAIQDVLTNPTVEESDIAMRVAEVAVFQNDNVINTNYQRAKSAMKKNWFTKPVGFLMDYQVPFVKTGSNIFLATLDYLGLPIIGGGAVLAVQAGKAAITPGEWQKFKLEMWDKIGTPEVRRTIAELAGKGLVGLSIATIGYFMAAAGYLEGLEEEDEKKRRQREATGSGAGRIRVGDNWYDIRQLSPVGTIMLAGASMFGATEKEAKDVFQRGEAFMKVLISIVTNGIPMARTLEEFSNPRATNLAQRLIAADSFVPSIVNEVGMITDDVARERKGETTGETIKNAIKAKLPGVRESLPVKEDVLGRPVEQPFGFDPFATKDDVSNAVTKEAADVGLALTMPKQRTKGDEPETLEQFRKRKADVTKLVNRIIEAALKDAAYPKSAPPEERKEILESGITQARQLVKSGEKVSDAELKEIVRAVIEGRKEIEEIEKDGRLDKDEKKRAKKRISQRTGYGIKSATDDDDNE